MLWVYVLYFETNSGLVQLWIDLHVRNAFQLHQLKISSNSPRLGFGCCSGNAERPWIVEGFSLLYLLTRVVW